MTQPEGGIRPGDRCRYRHRDPMNLLLWDGDLVVTVVRWHPRGLAAVECDGSNVAKDWVHPRDLYRLKGAQ